jgi:putative Holliday junction resolvase
MPLFNLDEFLAGMAPGARLLGLDPGTRRIGIAISDVGRMVASPYGVIARGKLKHNAAEITAVAAKEGVGGLVVGLPLDEAQRVGPAAQAARDWAHALSTATGLPVAMQDESFTTADAHETLIGAGLSREKRARMVDKLAAANILQAALDQARRI